MSTPAPRGPVLKTGLRNAPPQQTRQQIDELDALLQRMLTLPVKAPEDEDLDEADERALQEAAAGEESAESFGALATHFPMSEPKPDAGAAPEPLRTAVPEPVSYTSPAAVPGSQEERAPPSQKLETTVRMTSVIQQPAMEPRVRRGVLLQGLLWSNRAFDRWAGRLGAPGRWLRRPRGRSVLGWTGLLCLVAALVLLLKDWIR